MPSLDEDNVDDDAGEQAAPTHTPDGKKIPPPDLLVGELNFGVIVEQIREWEAETDKEVDILAKETPEQIVEALRELYDGIKALEERGLRGRDLFLAVKRNLRLMAISGRYYHFARTQIWGYRQQSVWFAR